MGEVCWILGMNKIQTSERLLKTHGSYENKILSRLKTLVRKVNTVRLSVTEDFRMMVHHLLRDKMYSSSQSELIGRLSYPKNLQGLALRRLSKNIHHNCSSRVTHIFIH